MRPRPSILIVEDDELIREFLADSLEMRGYEPTSVGNGAQAMQELETSTFDVVLSDIRVPEIDGVTLASEVRRRFPATPVVLITGNQTAQLDELRDQCGAAACLAKPLRIQRLCDVLEEARQV